MSSMGFICTPSILYVVFGGRYLMCVPSIKLIVLIWLMSRIVMALLSGFPYLHSAHVASHLVV